MRKLLLLPVTLPLAAARGALTAVVETVADALAGDLEPAPPPAARRRAPEPRPEPEPPIKIRDDEPTRGEPKPPTGSRDDETTRDKPKPPTGIRDDETTRDKPEPPTGSDDDEATRDEPEPPTGDDDGEPTLDEPEPPIKIHDDEPTRGEVNRRRVQERASGAVGAEVRVDAPWDGYDAMTAPEVLDRLVGADEATLAVVRLYESAKRNRATVLRATET